MFSEDLSSDVNISVVLSLTTNSTVCRSFIHSNLVLFLQALSGKSKGELMTISYKSHKMVIFLK